MKKFFKRFMIIALILVFVFLTYQYIQYKNIEVDEIKREIYSQEDTELEKELLDKQIQNANNFVEGINNDVALSILRTNGKVTLSHDKTPNNNPWTEWLFNSDIKIYAQYNTTFIIETNDIETEVDENATVTVYYDKRDIKLSSIDITDFTTSNNKSLFGSSYSPSQVAAFEQIARNTISEKTEIEKNINQAQKNLENYILTLANNCSINVKIIEK